MSRPTHDFIAGARSLALRALARGQGRPSAELTEAAQAFLDPVLVGAGATWDTSGWTWKPEKD